MKGFESGSCSIVQTLTPVIPILLRPFRTFISYPEAAAEARRRAVAVEGWVPSEDGTLLIGRDLLAGCDLDDSSSDADDDDDGTAPSSRATTSDESGSDSDAEAKTAARQQRQQQRRRRPAREEGALPEFAVMCMWLSRWQSPTTRMALAEGRGGVAEPVRPEVAAGVGDPEEGVHDQRLAALRERVLAALSELEARHGIDATTLAADVARLVHTFWVHHAVPTLEPRQWRTVALVLAEAVRKKREDEGERQRLAEQIRSALQRDGVALVDFEAYCYAIEGQ
eukprot:m51a1_g8592 hypothetical protein (282) ;mRNA; f:115792-134757